MKATDILAVWIWESMTQHDYPRAMRMIRMWVALAEPITVRATSRNSRWPDIANASRWVRVWS